MSGSNNIVAANIMDLIENSLLVVELSVLESGLLLSMYSIFRVAKGAYSFMFGVGRWP